MNEGDPEWHFACQAADVSEGRGKRADVDGRRVAIFRSGGNLFALDEMCTHAEASLAFGHIEDGCVACPWHYAQFDLRTGEARSLPAVEGVRAYPVRETDDGRIEVSIEEG